MAKGTISLIFIVLASVLSLLKGQCEREAKMLCPAKPAYSSSVSSIKHRNERAIVKNPGNHKENPLGVATRLNTDLFLRFKRSTNEGETSDEHNCPSVSNIKRAEEGKDIHFSNFIHPTNIEPVVINDRSRCLQRTVRKINMTSNLYVVVTSCCVTQCQHDILLRAEPGHSILLNFTQFKVPGLDLVSEEWFKTCKESLQIGVKRNSSKDGFYLEDSYCGIREPRVKFLQNNEVLLRLTLFENLQCVDNISFNVTISPCRGYQTTNACKDMKLNEVSKNEGYIISPGFDMDFYYPNNINCSVTVTVQTGKLIKFQLDIFILGDGDSLYVIPLNEKRRQFPYKFSFPGDDKHISTVIMPSNESTVTFTSNDVGSNIGFKLSYIAVNEDEFIPMFSNRSLDCSKLTSSIPRYMKCDFHYMCANGEDERDCPYRRNRCRDSGYFYKQHCYYVINNLNNYSWMEADDVCRKDYNARLISLNTVEERNFFDNLWDLHNLKVMYLGLKRMKREHVPQMYKRLWQWVDGNTALYLPNEFRLESWTLCTLFSNNYFHATSCVERKKNISIICETVEEPSLYINESFFKRNGSYRDEKYTQHYVFYCSSGEYIEHDLHCNGAFDCYDGSDEKKCWIEGKKAYTYECQSGQLLPYSQVCNGIYDCLDKSDETFCLQPSISTLPKEKAMCADGKIIDKDRMCDAQEDCYDASDENECIMCSENAIYCPMLFCFPKLWDNDFEIDCPIRDSRGNRISEISFRENIFHNMKPPGIVHPDGYGKVTIEKQNKLNECPNTHFQCFEGFCIPVYMLCNKYVDCPHGEDENMTVCEDKCKGFYKCKHSDICVHYSHICDNVYHCPEKDDEVMCSFKNLSCPNGCKCRLSEFTCNKAPTFDEIMPLSYLSVTQSAELELDFLDQIDKYSLIFLNISRNAIKSINPEKMHFFNLQTFDASNNEIQFLDESTFKNCSNLKTLILANNQIKGSIKTNKFNQYLFLLNKNDLKILDLSSNVNSELGPDCFLGIKNLQRLVLRNMGISLIHKYAFRGLRSLEELDLRGNAISIFSSYMFNDQQKLVFLMTDNFRLCCDSIMPESLEDGQCIAPFDELSSCTDLLRSTFLRVSLWIMATLTIIGNIGVIVFRIFFDNSHRINFRIIVTCLAASDLIMGIYLVIIGVADISFRNRYLVYEEEWKSSMACKVSGYLCLLSSEVSAMFILAATIDRLLVIAFPLRRELHLTSWSASVVSVGVWLVGLSLASVPLLPPFQYWELYSQRSMGVPLPITAQEYPGMSYTFAVFIVLNILIFILVSLGQLLIYLSVTRRYRPQMTESRMNQDTALAKRLALVVITDCLCWFPITAMGLLAKFGFTIPVDIHVFTTVFLLPANSALNPHLYTVNAVLSRRKVMKKTSSDSTSLTTKT